MTNKLPLPTKFVLRMMLVILLSIFCFQHQAAAEVGRCFALFSDATDVKDQIRRFVERMPKQDTNEIPSHVYEDFLMQLSKIDFNSNDHKFVSVHYTVDDVTRQYEIHPLLINGWKKLGFINAQGQFRFDLSLADIARRTRELTSFKPYVKQRSTSKNEVDHPYRFARMFVEENRIPIDDLHLILFHLPFLVEPNAKRAFLLMERALMAAYANTLQLSEKYDDVELNKLVNRYFEGIENTSQADAVVGPNGQLVPFLFGPIPVVKSASNDFQRINYVKLYNLPLDLELKLKRPASVHRDFNVSLYLVLNYLLKNVDEKLSAWELEHSRLQLLSKPHMSRVYGKEPPVKFWAENTVYVDPDLAGWSYESYVQFMNRLKKDIQDEISVLETQIPVH